MLKSGDVINNTPEERAKVTK